MIPLRISDNRVQQTNQWRDTNMEPGKRAMRVYFVADDIQTGATRVKELGGEADLAQYPGMGWFATCRAPQGTRSAFGRTKPPLPPVADHPR